METFPLWGRHSVSLFIIHQRSDFILHYSLTDRRRLSLRLVGDFEQSGKAGEHSSPLRVGGEVGMMGRQSVSLFMIHQRSDFILHYSLTDRRGSKQDKQSLPCKNTAAKGNTPAAVFYFCLIILALQRGNLRSLHRNGRRIQNPVLTVRRKRGK